MLFLLQQPKETRTSLSLLPKLKDFYYLIFFILFLFLGPHPQHMEVPRLGVESELQLLAYSTVTATPDPLTH